MTTILFPAVYDAAWGPDGPDRSDIERARIFLLRFTNMNADQAVNAEVRAIAMDQQEKSVPALSLAIQNRVFMSRHSTFMTSPLLQAVRYMLIRARVPKSTFSDRSRAIMDFFFDPTMTRNLNPPPEGGVAYPYPASPLKVCIVGGGPTALASAISLAEKGGGRIEVHMYERRWVHAGGRVDYPPTARRRDQVVTLQESVTELLSKDSLQALFQGRPERVWPGSANIQIRKVEDRLLGRCQDEVFRDQIYLHPQALTRETLAEAGDFHVLLGADGAASWVRSSYFHGYENERGRSYALGLAFDRPAGLPWSQPLNVFLTLGQTRYLLNASDHDGRGYLNMQLTEDEWDKMVALDGRPVTFGNPGCLRRADGTVPPGFGEHQVFAPSENRDSLLWQSIEDGLKLFGFKESEVINVVRIPIVVQAVREGVQYLPLEDSRSLRRPHALVAVAGDAAMTVHFWPGRGLNSGVKSGIALGDEIVLALSEGRFEGMGLDAMKEYNDFILKLQDREHDKRSIPILNQSGTPETLGWLLGKAPDVPDTVAVEWLVGAMTQIASRLETRHDWSFMPVAGVEPQVRIVLRQLRSLTLREMAVSFPWPTREMGGAEVLPIRSMKPEERQRWMQSLWKLLKDDKEKPPPSPRTPGRFDGTTPNTASGSRFEAPKQNGPMLIPDSGLGLKRSGAKSVRSSVNSRMENLSLAENRGRSSLKPEPLNVGRSPSPASGDGGLVRLLSTRKPNQAMFSDAMSLALFRVDE